MSFKVCFLCGVLFSALLCSSQPNASFFVDYTVSLYSQNLQMSSLIWLAPAACFYEAWVLQTPDPNLANRSTSSILVQVEPTDSNGTLYRAQNSYEIPRCNPMYAEPPSSSNFVYQVGPYLESLPGDAIISVLAEKSYRIRFCLYSGTGNLVAVSNWSVPIQTRSLAPSVHDMPQFLEGRSGGMVVITVILSISMFLLLVALGFVLATTKH
ncbi:hypothetical protein NDU88_009970 [Pleurodeles waltl]|uniref:Uroplakin-3a n=1 Tax=Pleurodeles waltl TaxID=8319 RepID=A0AAV7PXC2_PLEWA|nr:hypothetical protein NDU88_009970 [Pleurodeles waltl]